MRTGGQLREPSNISTSMIVAQTQLRMRQHIHMSAPIQVKAWAGNAMCNKSLFIVLCRSSEFAHCICLGLLMRRVELRLVCIDEKRRYI